MLIAIDDATLANSTYTSPINRNILASVVQRLDKLGTSVIGLDVLLDRASDPEADLALETAISEAETPIVLLSDPGRAINAALCENQPVPARLSQVLQRYTAIADTAHGVLCFDSLDDVVRRAPMARAEHVSFSERLAYIHSARDADGRAWLNIPFRPGETDLWPFATFSATSLEQPLPRSWFEGRIAIVGRISPYSGDFVATPLRFNSNLSRVEPKDLMPQAELPGMVVHAYTVNGLLDGRRGHYLTFWEQVPYVLLGTIIGTALVLVRLQLWLVLGGLVTLLAIFWWLVFAVFNASAGSVMIPFTGFASALLIVSGSLFAVQERAERDKRRFVQEGFSHFLSKKRVDEIVRSPSVLTRSAEERELTFLFTDLEGFTKLVDTMEPDALAPTLNGYLDEIIEVVARHDGTVDKIVGDAVHAMFSAPLEVTNHRLKAIQCALDILDVSNAYQGHMKANGIDLGRTRIGISCGKALVGNFGSSKRFDYTAHGSTVNLAARLEAANKTFGTSICVSEAARVEHPDLAYRLIGDIDVRGLVEPVRVFEALRADRIDADALQQYADALERVANQTIGSIDQLRALLTQHPDDGLVAYQLAQAKARLDETG